MQFQRGLVENVTGLFAFCSDGDEAKCAGGEQSETGGLGGGGCCLRGDGEDVGSGGGSVDGVMALRLKDPIRKVGLAASGANS